MGGRGLWEGVSVCLPLIAPAPPLTGPNENVKVSICVVRWLGSTQLMCGYMYGGHGVCARTREGGKGAIVTFLRSFAASQLRSFPHPLCGRGIFTVFISVNPSFFPHKSTKEDLLSKCQAMEVVLVQWLA